MTETKDISCINRNQMRSASVAAKATSLSELPLAGFALAVRTTLRKCATSSKMSDLDIAHMLEEVIHIYDGTFSPLSLKETVNLLESVSAALSVDAHDTTNMKDISSEAISIAEKLKKFDNSSSLIYATYTAKPSTRMFEMLTEACRYAKSGTFKAVGFLIYDAIRGEDSSPVLNVLQQQDANNGYAFRVNRDDIEIIVHLARSLSQKLEYSWVNAAKIISDAASFSNGFLSKNGSDMSALLDSAVNHMLKNEKVLRSEHVNEIEKIAIALFTSRKKTALFSEDDAIKASIELSRRIDSYKDNQLWLHIFSSALGIIVSQLSGEKTSVEISKNGIPYLKDSKHTRIKYFTEKLDYMRKKLGPDFKEVEGVAIACLNIVVKNGGFGSNDALLRKIEALRKDLFFSWIASTSENTKGEMNDDIIIIKNLLKGTDARCKDAFSMFIDSVSFVYGLGIHMERIGRLISIAGNK